MKVRATPLILIVMLAGLGAGCGRAGSDTGARGDGPRAGATGSDAEAAADLGFPGFATKNTTRVAGSDAVAIAAAVARAVYPATDARSRPDVVALVDARDWRAPIAAAVLAAPPLRAAILLSDGPRLPAASAAGLAALRPGGARAADGAQVVRVGDVARPEGLRSVAVAGRGPFALARALDAFHSGVRGRRGQRVVVVSADDPGSAIPAAAWAAKAGDPILFVRRDGVPPETRAALAARDRPRIYVVGPAESVSAPVVDELRRLGTVRRIGSGDAVRTSIDFARFVDGEFGWGVVDPGHGLVFVRADRPLDAAAAAALSASGSYGPLLALSNARRLDAPMAEYLLDIQPGYVRDPVRGVYNRGWIVGDDGAISVAMQSRIDGLLEITAVDTNARSARPDARP